MKEILKLLLPEIVREVASFLKERAARKKQEKENQKRITNQLQQDNGTTKN